jgi:hypothetical protein
MKTLVSGIIALSCIIFSAPGMTDTKDADRKFESMLKAIDHVPARADMLRIWPDAHRRLLKASQEIKRGSWSRRRAISLLSFFSEKPTRKTLEKLTSDSKPGIRSISFYTLGRTFGRPGDRRLVRKLKPGIADKNRSVRTFTIRALGWVKHRQARLLLKRLSTKHRDKGMRRIATRALKRLQ